MWLFGPSHSGGVFSSVLQAIIVLPVTKHEPYLPLLFPSRRTGALLVCQPTSIGLLQRDGQAKFTWLAEDKLPEPGVEPRNGDPSHPTTRRASIRWCNQRLLLYAKPSHKWVTRYTNDWLQYVDVVCFWCNKYLCVLILANSALSYWFTTLASGNIKALFSLFGHQSLRAGAVVSVMMGIIFYMTRW